MIDRRFDIRVPCEGPASLCWTDSTGEVQEVSASMVDISASGACVRTKRPVKIGTLLSLGFDNRKFTAKVKICASEPYGYQLGIEFQDD